MLTRAATRPWSPRGYGAVSDRGTGIASVTCNGAAAAITGGGFSCTVPLVAGTNHLTVQASDVAGHLTTRELDVTQGTALVPAPTALAISPTAVTLLVGESRRFAARDDLWRTADGATWSAGDPAILSVSTTQPGTVTAAGVGVTTLTVSWEGLTASANVTVAVGPTLPDGTTLWSLPAIAGTTITEIIEAVPTGDDTPSIYALARDAVDPTRPRAIRALHVDGREAWAVTAGPGATVQGLNDGGALIHEWSSVSAFDPRGGLRWRYSAPTSLSRTAIAADDTVYAVEQAVAPSHQDALIAVRGGAVTARWPLLVDPPDICALWCLVTGGAPMIDEDGSVFVATLVRGSPPGYPSYTAQDVRLIRLAPDGTLTATHLDGCVFEFCKFTSSLDVVLDGHGGAYVTWQQGPRASALSGFTHVARDGTIDAGVSSSGSYLGAVLGEDDWLVAHFLTVTGTHQLHYVRSPWAFQWVDLPAPPAGGQGGGSGDEDAYRLIAAAEGGSPLFATPNGPWQFGLGPVTLSAARYVGPAGAWVGGASGALAAQTGPAFDVATSAAAFAGANPHAQRISAKSYDSYEAAAIAALKRFNPVSVREDLEVCGTICQRTTDLRFMSTNERWWKELECRLPACGSGMSSVATWHTHGADVVGLSFSLGDLDLANSENVVIYLANVCGVVQKYVPGGVPAIIPGVIAVSYLAPLLQVCEQWRWW